MSDDVTLRIGGDSSGARDAVSRLKSDFASIPGAVNSAAQASSKAARDVGTAWQGAATNVKTFTEAQRNALAVDEQVARISAKFSQDTIDARLRAEAYSRAVREMGGAVSLTADQHREVSKAILAANDAYRVIGQQAPPHIQRLQRELHETSNQAGVMSRVLGDMKGVAAGMFAGFSAVAIVQGIQQIAGNALDAAGNLSDLSAQTGATASGLDRMRRAAEPAGVEINAIATSIGVMSDKLVSGDKSAVASLDRMKLSADALLESNPDEAFIRILEGLSRIPDPMERAKVAFDLFGGRAKDILRLVNAEFIENARHGKGWSDKQIEDLDRAGDAWVRLKSDIEGATGALIAWGYRVLDSTAQTPALASGNPESLGSGLAMQDAISGANSRAGLVQTPYRNPLSLDARKGGGFRSPALVGLTSLESAGSTEAIDRMAAAEAALAKLSAAQKTTIENNLKLGDSTKDIATAFGLTTDAVELFKDRLRAAEKASGDAETALEKLFKSQQEGIAWVIDLGEGLRDNMLALRAFSTEASKSANADFLKTLDEKIKAVAKANVDALTTINQKQAEVADLQRRRTMSTLEYELDALMRKGEAERNAMAAKMQLAGTSQALAEQAAAAIDDATAAGMESVIAQSAQAKEAILEVANALALLPGFQGMSEMLRSMGGGGVGQAGVAPKGGIKWGRILSNVPNQLVNVFSSGQSSSQIGGGIGSTAGSIGGQAVGQMASAMAASGFLSTGMSTLFAAGGNILPVLGPLIGGMLGKWVGGLFGPSKQAIANKEATGRIQDTKAGLEREYGSVDEIAKMSKAGAALAAGWNHQGVIGETAFKQLVEDFEASLEQQNDLLKEQDRLEGEIVSQEKERARLADSLIVKYSEVERIQKEYGITDAQLGGALSQKGTTERFAKIINDLDTLKRAAEQAGGELDWGGTLKGMSEEINVLVNESRKAGTAIPANMRPMLEEMQRNGQLVDENGQKLKDLSGIKFGDAIKTESEKTTEQMSAIDQTIQGLRDALAEVVTALKDLLPAAAQAGADGIETAVNRAGRTVRTVTRGMQDDFADTEDAATGAAWGHSPTGIKEISVVSKEAGKAVEQLGKISYQTFSTMEETAGYWAHTQVEAFDKLGGLMAKFSRELEDARATPEQRQALAIDRAFEEQKAALAPYKDDPRYADALAMLEATSAAKQQEAKTESAADAKSKLEEKISRWREKRGQAMELARNLSFTEGMKRIGQAAMGSTLGVVSANARAIQESSAAAFVQAIRDGQPVPLGGGLAPGASPTFVMNVTTWNVDGMEQAVKADIWPRIIDMIRRNDAGALSELRLAMGIV